MQELDDHALLRQYTEQNSEAAFGTLVARHVDKVYSIALRHTRNVHAAGEITQAVFVILAKKSGRLGGKVILSGWLYETARLTAVTFIRGEIRRARREQEAHMQTTVNENDSDSWRHIAPLLDDAMAGLSAADRHAIVLRYFDGKSLREVGAMLGASEDAAKKRVSRALDRLRNFFARRGVVLSAAALAAAIATHSVQAAPVALAQSVTAVAVAKGVAASGSTSTLIQGALKIMAWTKTQTAIVGVIVVAVTATTYSLLPHQTQWKLRQPTEPPGNQQFHLKTEKQKLSNQPAQAAMPQVTPGTKPDNLPLPPQAPASNQDPLGVAAPVPPVAQTTNLAGIELPRDSWTNAGFATPQTALQTRGWAVLNGDRELFQQSVFITKAARKLLEDTLVKMAEASTDPNKAQTIQAVVNNQLGVEEAVLMPMVALDQKNNFTGYKILSQQSPSANEMILEVETDMTSAPPQTETLNFQRFGNDWKVVYDQPMIQKMMKP